MHSFFLKKIFKKLVNIAKIILNKKILKMSFCFFCILFLFFAPYFVFCKNNFKVDNDLFILPNSQKKVLTMWHIETFEGGSASREKYLHSCAKKFSNIEKNCLIVIKTLSYEQLLANLENKDNLPDLFSFGIGSGYLLSSYLSELSKNTIIRDDLACYGMINDCIFAYPYIMSGYCVISRKTDGNNLDFDLTSALKAKTNANKKNIGFSFSFNKFLNPLNALDPNILKDIKLEKDALIESSSYEAYNSFISNKEVCSLLGTTRDFVRIKNREEKGSIGNINYYFLPSYTDLVQYVAVNKFSSNEKIILSKKFSQFLTEEECQSLLSNYGLFSTNGKRIYKDTDQMSNFEKCLTSTLISQNVFSSHDSIYNCQNEYKMKLN